MLFPQEIEEDALGSLYCFDVVYNGWDAYFVFKSLCFDHVRPVVQLNEAQNSTLNCAVWNLSLRANLLMHQLSLCKVAF